ncbi:cadherin-4-like [Lethenteron reissneri]|uniref:cadherin-4-like n=1 Tax=Lethenteron reissneri TaxID=7753 RepID=UPI002AB5FC51|nr:cadherin-4-like [Lethenteron reissneri]
MAGDAARLRRMVMLAVLAAMAVMVSSHELLAHLGQARARREWNAPPIAVTEGPTGPYPKYLTSVITDNEKLMKVTYRISGEGTDLEPRDCFSIDEVSGKIFQNKELDREERWSYKLNVQAYDDKGQALEQPLEFDIVVKDINDNAPEFSSSNIKGSVQEGVPVGAFVMQMSGTDRDQAGTDASAIAYRIVSQSPANAFTVDRKTGVVRTTSLLDRETVDSYSLVMEASDKNGDGSGLSSTTAVSISVGDINDNPPVFSENMFTGKVEENKKDVVIGRVKVTDADLVNTPAWRARYFIVSGNEGGNFAIETDPVTNEGVVKLIKPLDYEMTSSQSLSIRVENEVSLVSGSSSSSSMSVSGGGGGGGGGGGSSSHNSMSMFLVDVLDVDERPVFAPNMIRVDRLEGQATGQSLAKFKASAPTSVPGGASHIMRYGKLNDPANWLEIDPVTGDIRTRAPLDRESPYVVNNTYTATFSVVDETSPSGTSTGTMVVKLDDNNDNAPDVVTRNVSVCETGPDYVTVTASDPDTDINGKPFTFELPADSAWTVSETDGTSAVLKYRSQRIPRGMHAVPLMVRDRLGLGEVRNVTVSSCPCEAGSSKPSCEAVGIAGSRGGGLSDGALAGILAGILGFLMLGILLLLCCCKFGKKQALIGKLMGELPKSSLSTSTRGEEQDKALGGIQGHSEIVPLVTKGSASANFSSGKVTKSKYVNQVETVTESESGLNQGRSFAKSAGAAGAAAGVAAGAAAGAGFGAGMGAGAGGGAGAMRGGAYVENSAAGNMSNGHMGTFHSSVSDTEMDGSGYMVNAGGGGGWPITTLARGSCVNGGIDMQQQQQLQGGFAEYSGETMEHSDMALMESGGQMGQGGGDTAYFMTESLKILDQDVAAPDTLLIFNQEGTMGGSQFSLVCQDML